MTDQISITVGTIIMVLILSAILLSLIGGIFMSMPVNDITRKTLKFKIIMTAILLIAKIYAKLKRGQVIYLLDYNDLLYITVAFKFKIDDSKLRAFTYLFTKFDLLDLKPNGTLFNESHYIRYWLPYDKFERIKMILTHNARNFI